VNHLGCFWEAESSNPFGHMVPAVGGLAVLTAGYCLVTPHALVDFASYQGFVGMPEENTSKRYSLGLYF